MLGLRKPHELPLSLANVMNDVIADAGNSNHPEILHHQEGFDFVPGNRSLSAVEVNLVHVMSRETVLRQYIDSVKSSYDYVLLDCHPSLGMLVINALAASDYVLTPVQADYLAAENMTELIGTVQRIQRQIHPSLQIGGIFLTMVNETNFRREIAAAVREKYGKRLPILQATIPATVLWGKYFRNQGTAPMRAQRSGSHGERKRKGAGRVFAPARKRRIADFALTQEVLEIGEKQRGKPFDLSR